MLHTKFRGNRLTGYGEEDFWRVFTIYGRPSWLCDQHQSSNFHFLVPEKFHTKLVMNGTAVSEKIWFEILYVHNHGQRSKNDLDLQYSYTFITQLVVCI